MNRDDIAHYFDDNFRYKVIYEFDDCYLLEQREFNRILKYLEHQDLKKDERDMLKELMQILKDNSIYSKEYQGYLINPDKMIMIFDEFSEM